MIDSLIGIDYYLLLSKIIFVPLLKCSTKFVCNGLLSYHIFYNHRQITRSSLNSPGDYCQFVFNQQPLIVVE